MVNETFTLKKQINESTTENPISAREAKLLEIQRQENKFKIYIEELKTSTPSEGRSQEDIRKIFEKIEQKMNENFEEIRKSLE
ncbi:MAG: hypothetical protein WC011_02255 [Candidatus Paceibacterota bacterium]